MADMQEMYWIGSSDRPERMYFNSADALDSDHEWLDSFDKNGMPVKTYKMIDDRYVDQQNAE